MKTSPKTYVAIILDKSGSMASTKASAISGFNEQVQQLKENAKTQEIYCSLVTFNGEIFEHLWNVPADQLVEANPDDFKPIGSTAMLDAVGYTIQKLISTTNHEDPNTAYLVITISDGETNADMHYNFDSLKELNQGCEASKRWTFTYMGCSKDYLEQLAVKVGVNKANMAAWSNKTAVKTAQGFSNMKSRSAKYFAERSEGQTAACNFASNDDQVADYEDEVQDATPTPVIVAAADMPKVDLASVLGRQPKYQNQNATPWNGGPIFSNSLKVEWEASASEVPESSMAAASPNHRNMNHARIWKK